MLNPKGSQRFLLATAYTQSSAGLYRIGQNDMSSDAEKKNGENIRQRKNMNTSDTDLTRIAQMTGSDLILLGETMKGTIQ